MLEWLARQVRSRSTPSTTNEFVGAATDGVEGGGFLYTNLDSVSVGLVVGMKDLRASGWRRQTGSSC